MTLISRLKAFINDNPAKVLIGSAASLLGRDVKRPEFNHHAAVAHCRSWVYAAARLNAVAVASQPLRLYVRRRDGAKRLWETRRTGRRTKAYLAGDLSQMPSRHAMTKAAEFGDDYEIVTDKHPVLELLSMVNPYQNGFDATLLRVLYLELTGNAYLHPLLSSTTKVPVQLWTMPSQWMEIVPGDPKKGESFIRGYRYGATEQQKVEFAPDEIIHFKQPNPGDMYYGLGKVEAAWGAVTSNVAIHEMDYFFFQNKSRPDYLVVAKGNASEAELDRFTAEVETKLRGTKKTGRFLSVTADIDLKPLQFPPKDLQGREEVVEEIAAIFGVPVSMLRANDPNLASATVGFATWKETTVLPMLRMDEEVLNQSLLPLFGIGEDAFLAYDNPVRHDEAQETGKRLSYVQGGILTANEARELEGLERSDDPNADRLLIGGQPLGGAAAPAASPFAGLFGAASAQPLEDEPPTPGTVTDMETEPVSGEIDKVSKVAPIEATETKAIERKDALGDCVSAKISKLLDEGYEQDQAVAIAYSMCMGKGLEESIGKAAVGDIDTKPPAAVAENARRALEVRETKPESERGMTEIGIARARDLANRANLSEDTIRRMVAYFERHEKDKRGETWDDQGKGWQAWNGWGGDEGFAWARRKRDEFDRAREKKSCGCEHGSCAKAAGNDPPAKPSERITGSDRNPEGSASGSRGGIEISEATEEALRNKVEEHNEKYGDTDSKKVDLGMLKAVYRRGAGAFSTSHRRGVGREQWALARVNAFLYLVRNGKPKDADYTTDFDLLPEGHPKKSDAKRFSLAAIWTKAIEAGEIDFGGWLKVKSAEKEAEKIGKAEAEAAAKVSSVFDAQTKAVLAALRKAERPTQDLISQAERLLRSRSYQREIVEALAPYLREAIATGVSIGIDTVSKVAPTVDFAVERLDLERYAETESIRLARRTASGVTETQAVRFKEVLGNGVAEGETVDELAVRVQEWAASQKDQDGSWSRARTVARTEAMRAARTAEVEAWTSTGLVKGKTWLLAPDPCEFCEAAAKAFGENAIGLGDSFYTKGEVLTGADGNKMTLDFGNVDGPPLHPNCRCSMQPQFDDELEQLLAEDAEEAEKLAQAEARRIMQEEEKDR